MHKGFWFSIEAMLALLIILALIISFPWRTPNDFSALLVLQKQHDLAKVWQETRTTSAEEMQQDIAFVFPSHSFELRIENKTVQKTRPGWQPNASSIEANIWKPNNESISVWFKVYY